MGHIVKTASHLKHGTEKSKNHEKKRAKGTRTYQESVDAGKYWCILCVHDFDMCECEFMFVCMFVCMCECV